MLLVHAQALVEAHELGVLLLHAGLQPLDAILSRAVALLSLRTNSLDYRKTYVIFISFSKTNILKRLICLFMKGIN